MKKRKTIFKLLNDFSVKDKVPKVRIQGSQTGLTLYEGGLFAVPFGLCSDYVLQYETCGNELLIISACSSYYE